MAGKKHPWFRLYAEIINDRKVQMLPGNIFKAWINLMCIASENTPRGTLPDNETLAFMLRANVDEIVTVTEALRNGKLLDKRGDTFTIHGWKERQFESDDDPTNRTRQRRYRNGRNNGRVTGVITVVSRSPDTDTDTDTDTDKYKSNSNTTDATENTPSAAVSATPSPQEKTDPLYHAIKDSFEVMGGKFSNYAKEGQAIKRIIKIVDGSQGEARRQIETFYRLTKSPDKFWSAQPFTPSVLASLWDRVKVQATKQAEVVDWMAEVAG